MRKELTIKAHWEEVFQTKDTTTVSWYNPTPWKQLALLQQYASKEQAIIDVGGGDSNLPDYLLQHDFQDVTVLDISSTALTSSQSRLGENSHQINWLVTDVLALQEEKKFDVWYDRAAFHFFREPKEQRQYVQVVQQHLNEGGFVILGGFSSNQGPEKCSGLFVQQHNQYSIEQLFAPYFSVVDGFEQIHITPSGAEQNFQWTILQRKTQ